MPDIHDSRVQAVSCVLVITAYGHGGWRVVIRIFRSVLAQPIFSGDIVSLFFLAFESGGLKSQLCVLIGVVFQCKRTEQGLETISFPSVEIDFEVLGTLGRTERGFPAIRGEFIIIVSEVSQEIDFPFGGQLVRDVSLQIDKFRVVFGVSIHGAQNRPTAFKAETRYLGKFTDRTTHVSIRTQQTCGSRAFEQLRFFIGNIQHGTHLVSVTSLEAAGGEIDRLRQVRIDKAKALLLSRANQKRTEYLDPIHINDIFIITTSTYGILGT